MNWNDIFHDNRQRQGRNIKWTMFVPIYLKIDFSFNSTVGHLFFTTRVYYRIKIKNQWFMDSLDGESTNDELSIRWKLSPVSNFSEKDQETKPITQHYESRYRYRFSLKRLGFRVTENIFTNRWLIHQSLLAVLHKHLVQKAFRWSYYVSNKWREEKNRQVFCEYDWVDLIDMNRDNNEITKQKNGYHELCCQRVQILRIITYFTRNGTMKIRWRAATIGMPLPQGNLTTNSSFLEEEKTRRNLKNKEANRNIAFLI